MFKLVDGGNSLKKIHYFTFIAIFMLLAIAVPAGFAADEVSMNDTTASVDEDILSDDYYFDVNSDIDGNGSADSPYNNFTPDRIKSDSAIHLASGEYNLTSDISREKLSFYGISAQDTILNGNGYTLTSNDLTFTNITLRNIKIVSNAAFSISANNTVFRDCDSSDNHGGVIRCDNAASMTFTNCSFLNNSAIYGGAIYSSQGSVNISNCTFENNSARYGGAIYIGETYFQCYDSIFRNNVASMLGGAVISDNCKSLEFNNASFENNRAGFEGGAIYSIFGVSFIFNSSFTNNSANAGGALFIDTNQEVNITGNKFRNNRAYYSAGAIYSLTNYVSEIVGNTYDANTALFENDLLETEMPFAFVGDGNYVMFNFNSTSVGDLPSYYNLKDEGYVTPVKNQGSGGNCWAFAALAALESCILKASGTTYDLSEGNMKNMMALYSDYGWDMEPNRGGYDRMGVGYLTGWLGPINETDDPYSASNQFSFILNSLTHVQNIIFLTRDSYVDNDNIKRAIMDYGAVSTSIAWYGKYQNGKNYYCYNDKENEDKANHAIAIVGWDDNYSRNNFGNTQPPGDGAWIIKNSWGVNSGDKGFYYVSYYDTKMAKPGKTGASFTFILNDTIKFDKNYQYDIPGKTDIFLNSSSTVWYKNVFNATDNEYLAAVSTYFDKDTNWTVYIYVNDDLRLVQSGFAKESYSTINLNQFIPLTVGDIFEVVFKITVDGDTGFPISERVSLVTYFYKENISFVSYDGENWTDLYNLSWTYPGHTYNSQVACIKAFTILDEVNTTLKLISEISGGYKVKAMVFNEYGRQVTVGNVTFIVNGETYEIPIVGGFAILDIFDAPVMYNISAAYENIGYLPSYDNMTLDLYSIATQLNLTVSGHNPVNITAHVTNEYGQPIDCGNVTFILDGHQYVVNVTNGVATLVKIFEILDNHSVSAVFNSIYYYNSSNTQQKDFNVSLINTFVDLTFDNESNPISIYAIVIDEYGNAVNYGNVTLFVDGEIVVLNVINGSACLVHSFANFGSNNVAAVYNGLNIYNSSNVVRDIFVRSKTYINMVVDGEFNPLNITAYVLDEHNERVNRGSIIFIVDNAQYYFNINGSNVSISYSFLNFGANNVSVVYNGFSNYMSSQIVKSINVKSMTFMNLTVTGEYDPVTITAKVLDEYGRAVDSGNVTFIVEDEQYVIRVVNGTATLTYSFKNIGSNGVHAVYDDSNIYNSSEASIDVSVKTTIISSDATKTLNSKYQFKLLDAYGNPLNRNNVTVNINSKEYQLTTDENGNAVLDITFNPGIYSIVITNPVNNESTTQTINVVKRITENKAVTMYYGAGKYYKVKVFDDNGNIAKSVKVTFKINGLSYTRTTDSNGYASFKISQKPGKYTITAEYKGFKVSNKINVKSTIITKNIKVKKGKTIKFTAKLVDKNGKILKNKKIKFKFKGKTYKIKTNKKGKATLKITKHYKAGKYSITTSYGKLKIKNTITIK